MVEVPEEFQDANQKEHKSNLEEEWKCGENLR